jgi:hypothetical protein
MLGGPDLFIQHKGGIFYLTGSITEFSDLTPLEMSGGDLVLNMGQVRFVNSSGVRRLILMISKRKGRVEYHHCRPDFVELINITVGIITDQASVVSMYLNHDCHQCDTSQSVLIHPSEIPVHDGSVELEPLTCPSCSQAMEPERAPDELLYFLLAG